jgi:hypothetical protein
MPIFNTKVNLELTTPTKGTICELTKLLKFDTVTKLEQTFYIKNTDGAITLDLSKIDNAKIIIVYTPITGTSFNTRIVRTITGISGTTIDDITLEQKDLFILSPYNNAFFAEITTFAISTDSTTDVEIGVKVLGI